MLLVSFDLHVEVRLSHKARMRDAHVPCDKHVTKMYSLHCSARLANHFNAVPPRDCSKAKSAVSIVPTCIVSLSQGA